MKKIKFIYLMLIGFSLFSVKSFAQCPYPGDACGTCVTISMPPDPTICLGSSYVDNFASYVSIPAGLSIASYSWSPGSVSPVSGPPPALGLTTFTPSSTTTYTLDIDAQGPNLINDGDFESWTPGMPCFLTDYSFYTGTTMSTTPVSYAVGPDPFAYGLVHLADHTVSTGPPIPHNMLIERGGVGAGTLRAWAEYEIPVCVGEKYEFDFYYASVSRTNHPGGYPQLQVYINGAAVGPVFTPTSATWNHANIPWSSVIGTGGTTMINIEIKDLNTVNNENSFALDDITLRRHCRVSSSFTVNVSAPTISGPATVCTGSAVTFTGTPAGGTFSAPFSIISVAPSGLVVGMAVGTDLVTYTAPDGCTVTQPITVIASPATILGPYEVCQGSTITLTDATPGGTWGTTDPSVLALGFVGVSPGSAYATYTDPGTGCSVSHYVLVDPLPNTIPTQYMCIGQTLDLTPLSSPPGGSWWSFTSLVGYFAISTTGIITGVSSGTAICSYTSPAGCSTYFDVKVYDCSSPVIVGGGGSLCPGYSTTLIGLPSGGTWTSTPLPPGVVFVPASGYLYVPYGTSGGTVTFTYTVGGVSTTTTVTIVGSATATIAVTGTPSLGFDLTSTCVSSGACATSYDFQVYDVAGHLLGGPSTYSYSTTSSFLDYYTTVLSLPTLPGYPSTADAYSICLTGVWCNCCWNPASACAHVNPGPKTTPSLNQGKESASLLTVIPNPNNGTFTVKGDLTSVKTSKEATIEVVDLVGRVIYKNVVPIEHGGINTEVKLGSDVANAMYLVRIKNDEVNEVIKFTLER